jgi:glycosyltransferase XagB
VWIAYPTLPSGTALPFIMLAGLNLVVLLAGYGVSITLTWRALRRQGISGWYGTLASLPLYWLLMSVAAWLALWQFATKPFHWNKTEHGLSSVQRVRRRRARHTG